METVLDAEMLSTEVAKEAFEDEIALGSGAAEERAEI